MRFLTYAIIAIVVAIAAIVAVLVVRNWKYHGYSVLRTARTEDTISTSYAEINGNILQYNADVVRLQDRQGQEQWSISCSFQDPRLATCGGTLALYDKNRTEILVANSSGRMGAFTAQLPIVKACVSEQGNVATIQEDDSNAWIEYYAPDGAEIASIKTSMENPGYPLDLALSPNGELLAVSYLSFTDGVQKTLLHIYSFGSAGQNQMDNRIGEFSYVQKVVPQLVFLDNRSCVAFREDGFDIYEGAKVPKLTKEITVEREIRSTFCDGEYIALIVSGATEGTSQMKIYNRSGGALLDQEITSSYERMEIRGGEISLYNGSSIHVYSLNGTEKFDGSYSGDARRIFAIGKHRYVVVMDSGFELIQLR